MQNPIEAGVDYYVQTHSPLCMLQFQVSMHLYFQVQIISITLIVDDLYLQLG